MRGTVTVAALDADLAELNRRQQNCRDLIHHCLIDLAGMGFRADVLLERRNDVAKIEAAAHATMNPGRRP